MSGVQNINTQKISLQGSGSIFLTGFMGSGKTYWGKKWAQGLGREFIDLDDLLEKEERQTIAEIFAGKGEAYFRRLETDTLRRLGKRNDLLIATGGGTPCFDDNISWMNNNGTTVYLRSSPANIAARLVIEKEKRPLLKNLNDNELLFYITEKIKERELFYNQAKIILDVDDLPEDHIQKL